MVVSASSGPGESHFVLSTRMDAPEGPMMTLASAGEAGGPRERQRLPARQNVQLPSLSRLDLHYNNFGRTH